MQSGEKGDKNFFTQVFFLCQKENHSVLLKHYNTVQ